MKRPCRCIDVEVRPDDAGVAWWACARCGKQFIKASLFGLAVTA